MKFKAIPGVVICIVIIICYGCSTVQDSIVKGATRGVGRALSERAEQKAYSKLAPKTKLPQPKTPGWNQFMALQAQVIFAYSFSAGGLWLGGVGYKPGEWTKFEFTSEDQPGVVIEKAFLKKLESGREWWRVSWIIEEESWVYEALISTTNGELLRLRGRDADGNEGEIPVTSGETIYNEPAELTKESIEGATVDRETISTPTGTFNTDHVIYMATTGEGQVEWWLTDEVPGGVARYLLNDKEEGEVWRSTIKEKGTNASSVLNSF